MTQPTIDPARFIANNTRLMAPPLVPEIQLYLADEAVPLWQKTEEELGEINLPPPFWAFAWAGGQALARFIIDHPIHVRQKRVLDLASGSGLVAISAMKANAASVMAADIDPFALAAIKLNEAANGIRLNTTGDDLLITPPPDHFDIILVGDLFYEKSIAEELLTWLKAAKSKGISCLIGDPGRSYLPQQELRELMQYQVPVTRDLEDAEIKNSRVWSLKD